MGGISRRAGLGGAARRSLKTAAAQTLPGPALPLPAIRLCEQREENAAKAAERRLPLRSGRLFGSDGLCGLALADLARLLLGGQIRRCSLEPAEPVVVTVGKASGDLDPLPAFGGDRLRLRCAACRRQGARAERRPRASRRHPPRRDRAARCRRPPHRPARPTNRARLSEARTARSVRRRLIWYGSS